MRGRGTRRAIRARVRCFPVAVALVLSLAACTDAAIDVDEVEVPADDGEGKADLSSELRVRAGDTTVWVTRALGRRVVDGRPAYVLRGRTSRNLTGGFGFVIDDPYGDFAQPSARTFELSWPVSTARTLVDGVNQFVRLETANGRPASVTARVVVRPRLESISGSSKLYLTAELTPVSVGGTVAYRIAVKSTGTMTAIVAQAGGVALSGVRTLDATHAAVDLLPDHLFATAGVSGAAGVVTITATVGGATVTKTARLGLSVKKLGITTGDAYELWPRPVCEDETRACLASLPDGTTDLAACGEWLEVQACARAGGAVVDEAAFQAALAAGIARVGSAAFRSDASGLVGADRVEQLVGGAEQTIESHLQALFGRRYADVATRTAALTAATDAAIDAIYARPLDVIEPHAPAPDDLAAARQVAADALLAELATFDFVHSEYARPLEELTRTFRARHVADLRSFREAAELDGDVFIGRWLDPYVEVAIDPATGAATRVLIEID